MSNGERVRTTSRGVSPLFLLLRTLCVSVCFCSVFLCGVCVGYQEQKFAMEPQDQVCFGFNYIFLEKYFFGHQVFEGRCVWSRSEDRPLCSTK